MKLVRPPFSALCASWGFLLGKAYEQAEFSSASLVDLPSFRHPQLTLFSIPRLAGPVVVGAPRARPRQKIA
jgi:hypothetical protein